MGSSGLAVQPLPSAGKQGMFDWRVGLSIPLVDVMVACSLLAVQTHLRTTVVEPDLAFGLIVVHISILRRISEPNLALISRLPSIGHKSIHITEIV